MTKALMNKRTLVRASILAACEDAVASSGSSAVLVYRDGWAGTATSDRAAQAMLASDPTCADPHHVVASRDFGCAGVVTDEDIDDAAEQLFDAWVELA
jgi:hypothetical protein